MYADTYTSLSNSFNEWLMNSPTGGEYVSNLTLDYANRAQDSLEHECPQGWTLLTRSSQLTISSLVATLPSDCGLLLAIYSDTDEDKKPDRYYFKDGRIIEGFKFIPAFTKAAGHTATIQFYQDPDEPVFIDYQVDLDDFTGSGTEYLFFPLNIMLGKMQYLRCLDKGSLNEWQGLATEFTRELDRFKSQNQNNTESPDVVAHDYRGKEIYLPKHDLSGGMRRGGHLVGSTNDRDVYRG